MSGETLPAPGQGDAGTSRDPERPLDLPGSGYTPDAAWEQGQNTKLCGLEKKADLAKVLWNSDGTRSILAVDQEFRHICISF